MAVMAVVAGQSVSVPRLAALPSRPAAQRTFAVAPDTSLSGRASLRVGERTQHTRHNNPSVYLLFFLTFRHLPIPSSHTTPFPQPSEPRILALLVRVRSK